MKYIITESRLERIAIKWLNDNYGDLEPYETEEEPDYIFYKKGNRIVFNYDKSNGHVFVDYDEIWSFFENMFSMDYLQIQYITKMWIEEHYNLRVTRITAFEFGSNN
jgi:hypothetical protein